MNPYIECQNIHLISSVIETNNKQTNKTMRNDPKYESIIIVCPNPPNGNKCGQSKHIGYEHFAKQ